VIPTSPASVQIRFCHLRKVYHRHFVWSRFQAWHIDAVVKNCEP
jgi:hypothetical protein